MKIKLTNGAKEFHRGTGVSTGLDLRARGVSRIVDKKVEKPKWFKDDFNQFTVKPMERVLIKTGVHIQPDKPMEDEEGNLFIEDFNIRPRSGLSLKEGAFAIQGTIDIDYRKDVGVIMVNLSDEDLVIKEDERVAQLVTNFALIDNNIEYTDELEETGRGGFGHTGKK